MSRRIYAIPITMAAEKWHDECVAGRWVPLHVSAELENKLAAMTIAKGEAVEALRRVLRSMEHPDTEPWTEDQLVDYVAKKIDELDKVKA